MTKRKVDILNAPSDELHELMLQLVQSLDKFAEKWELVKKKGAEEGFTEKQLKYFIGPMLKKKLNEDQRYYLFHSEKKKAASKIQYENNRNIPENDDNKDTEESSIKQQEEPQTQEITVNTDGSQETEPQPKRKTDTPKQEFSFSTAADLSNTPKEPHDFKFEKEQLPPLNNITEDLKAEIERLKGINDRYSTELTELRAVVAGSSFKPATEVTKSFTFNDLPNADNSNIFIWKNIKLDKFRMELGPIKASGDTPFNIYLERVKK